MKKINNVNIKNLKILKDISLELGNLTLITGVNSSGKSTFIQSLLLLKQNQELLQQLETGISLKTIIEDNKEGNDHIIKFIKESDSTPLNINGKYIHLVESKDILNETVFNEDIIISLTMDDCKPYTVNCNNKDLTISLDLDRENFSKNRPNLFAKDFQYVNTDRIQPDVIYPMSEIEIRQNLIGLKGEYTAHYLDENRHKILVIDALKHEKSQTNQFLENVSLWLNEISNGIEVLAKKNIGINKASLSYKYTFGDNVTNEYKPMNVGFGITYVLPIIVAILKSKPDDLLIIENPESHLHPAGQSKIAELCAIASSNGVQIIVETHSDHFLNGVRVATKKELLKPEDSRVYFFEKEDETMSTKVHELNIDYDGRINEDWPKGFFDEWDNKLNELIW